MASSSRELTIEGVRYEILGTQRSDSRSENFTIEFLRRVSQGSEDLRPTWDEAKQNYVVQKLKHLIERGKADKDARDPMLIDSGLTNGLALRLNVEGIKVHDLRNYSRQMKQYLKKESKILSVPIRLPPPREERISHQRRPHFRRRADGRIIVNIRVSKGGWLRTTGCKSILGFYFVLVVPRNVMLEKYDIANRYYLRRQVPCALNPDVTIDVSHFLTFLTDIYSPQHSFVGRLTHCLLWERDSRVKLMHVQPHCFRRNETGIIPFIFPEEVRPAWTTDFLEPVNINPASS